MNPVWIWFGLGALCVVGEMFTLSFVIIFFAAGAWAAAITAAFFPGLEQELAVFITVSLLTLFTLRKKLVNVFMGNKKDAKNSNGPAPFIYAGQNATVTETIPADGVGEISLGGSFWRATATEEIPQGQDVIVIDAVPENQLLLRVRKHLH